MPRYKFDNRRIVPAKHIHSFNTEEERDNMFLGPLQTPPHPSARLIKKYQKWSKAIPSTIANCSTIAVSSTSDTFYDINTALFNRQ